jgi:hypothetical protein
MLYNPYFTQMLNPAYLDVIDCPYLNYARSPSDVSNLPEIKKQHVTVPVQNVSNFIDSLKYDWESLPQATKDEYYAKLHQMLQTKPLVENFDSENETSINTDYPHEMSIYIIYFLTMLGFILYYAYFRDMKNGHFFLAAYLVLIIVGSGLYYFSHR